MTGKILETEKSAIIAPTDKAVSLWNEFIAKLSEAEVAWAAFSEFADQEALWRSEQLPVKLQKMMAKFGKQNFQRMGPEFIGHVRGLGGIKEQKI